MRVELIDQCRYRWPDILVSVGIDKNYLINRHGPCPICAGRDRFRFDNKTGNGEYFCNSCGAGNGIVLVMRWLNQDFKETAKIIRAIIGECRVTETTPIDSEEALRKNTERLKKIHSGLKKITQDDPAGKYLANRRITVMPEQNCFYHPSINLYEDGKLTGAFPAMVSIFRNNEGETASYHVTYLNENGAKLQRKILPVIRTLNGCAIKLFAAGPVLCIAEGIESALSVFQDTGHPCWAAGNAGLMEKVIIPKDVQHVIIYADSDPSFRGMQAAFNLANRISSQHQSITVVTLVKSEQVFHNGAKFDMNDYIGNGEDNFQCVEHWRAA